MTGPRLRARLASSADKNEVSMTFSSDGSRKLPRRMVLLGAMSGMAVGLSGCDFFAEAACNRYRERRAQGIDRAVAALENAINALGLERVGYDEYADLVDPNDTQGGSFWEREDRLENHPNYDLATRLNRETNSLVAAARGLRESDSETCEQLQFVNYIGTAGMLLEETYETLVEQGDVDVVQNFDVPTTGTASEWIDAWWDWSSP